MVISTQEKLMSWEVRLKGSPRKKEEENKIPKYILRTVEALSRRSNNQIIEVPEKN